VNSSLTLYDAFSRLLVMNSTTLTSTPIRRAAEADITTVAAVLADSFFADPVIAWCVPDPARRAAILPPFFALITATILPFEEVYLTETGGAALWVPAGEPPVPEADEARFGEALVDMVGDDAERTLAIVELLETHHPTEANQYLWLLGVVSAAQGLGIGSSLLASMLRRCDRDGTPAYLEATSPANRRLYERHGFVVRDEIAVADSPPLWTMWRAPVVR
jgi:GNAT superfamily N-acetyltransferase